MEQPKLEIDDVGSKRWILPNGNPHRIDGPAIEYADGTKYWYQNGNRHRTDGPAIEWFGGTKSYYLNDKKYTEEEFEVEMLKKKLELFG